MSRLCIKLWAISNSVTIRRIPHHFTAINIEEKASTEGDKGGRETKVVCGQYPVCKEVFELTYKNADFKRFNRQQSVF